MPDVVLITGCSNGGIGAALARCFLNKGYIVYATARSLKALSDLDHPNVRKLVLDVTSQESVAAAVEQVYGETEGIDILISNAGFSHVGTLLDTPYEEGAKVMETNFFGFVRLVKHIVPRMGKRGKGTVVAIGSILGELATPFQGFYNASKAALHSYTETLRMECTHINVKVVLVSPGSIKSNICANSHYTLPDDSLFKALEKQIRFILFQSQSEEFGVMDTDSFAKTVVSKVSSTSPPQYITLGGFTRIWGWLKWLPRTTAEALLWKIHLKEPKSEPKSGH
ncbi:hypothetical protein FB45DRAFT_183564 [Roridomyces roridus]|uniref:Uncharacterized protein n=1 Tax=Roridomyces roridus TaxID=1738132 RepID=A0AAD7CEQ1_9AGAR|nr:hypothetical protein FB45DRAFT_183564 [Roridomyces roridus]